jgi:acetyltransferase
VQGTEDGYREALVAALDEADAALAIDVNTPYIDAAPIARGVVAAARATGKPVAACFMAGKTVAAGLPILKEGGVPNFATGERAVRVLAAMAAYRQLAGTLRRFPPTAGVKPGGVPLPWVGEGLEPEVLDWLEGEGIPTPRRRLVTSAEGAADAVDALGGSIVLKVVASGISHKTDVGGVIQNVETKTAARDAFERLRAVGGKGFRGALVAPMVQDGVELLVGLSRDPQFGPVVAVGLGGVHAEVFRDVSLRVAPVDAAEAHVMLGELRGAAILRGARGAARRDLDAAAELVAGVSCLPFRYADLAELDLNPVFLLEDGLVVGDARAVKGDAAATRECGGSR